MKISGTNQFVFERMKIRPVTNAEWEQIEKDISKNPFGLTKDDLVGYIEKFPMGVVVKMLEEQQRQGNRPNVTLFQKYGYSGTDKQSGGFTWARSSYIGEISPYVFWKRVMKENDFDLFFEEYPEYKKYNLD